jgi:flagellar motility protein MotE (MotC chaperone)
MIRFIREFRLIPVVLLATSCLLALKILGIALEGGFTLADLDFSSATAVPNARPDNPGQRVSWAHDMFSFPDVTGSVGGDKPAPARHDADERVAGAAPAAAKPGQVKVAEAKPGETKAAETKPAETKPGETKAPDAKAPPAAPGLPPLPKGGGTRVQLDQPGPGSPAERALLERLGERRQELDTRARELEIRESLVKSAEHQLDTRVNQLRVMETQANGAAAKKEQEEAERLQALVSMYENMRAKDAAKIFNRLEMPVLLAVVSHIKPRVMADIMAQMQPEVAEKLTVELANRAAGLAPAAPAATLPKIEGRPR